MHLHKKQTNKQKQNKNITKNKQTRPLCQSKILKIVHKCSLISFWIMQGKFI